MPSFLIFAEAFSINLPPLAFLWGLDFVLPADEEQPKEDK